MCVDQLRLIFADYVMDLELPTLGLGKWRGEFERISYSRWAAEELYNYLIGNCCDVKITLEEAINRTLLFLERLKCYKHFKKKFAFDAAIKVATDILEEFTQMKGE